MPTRFAPFAAFWRWVLWLTLAGGLASASAVAAGAAGAADVPDAHAKQVRKVIEAQLQAFAADDAKQAFSYATPKIQAQFGTPEVFLQMVRQSYPVVYRPASRTFLKPERQDGSIIQVVQMADQSGHVWLATYQLQRLKNRLWRINGCLVTQGPGQAT